MADVRHEPRAEETAPLLPRDAQSYRAERLAAARTRGVFPALLTAFMVSCTRDARSARPRDGFADGCVDIVVVWGYPGPVSA